MIHYICKYTPVELFSSFGEEASFFNPMPENLDMADTVTHRNMCSFSRALISERLRDGSEMLVLTDCCDSIRRTEDVLRSNKQDTMMLSLPWKSDACGKALYKEELIRVTEHLEKRTGSGRFLEMMAQSLGITLEEMSVMGFEAEEDIIISSMCSVFAQSEVVSLIASGNRLQDIVHGINCSVAAKVTALAGRSGLQREWMMTEGVARNRGVVAAIEERLQGTLLIPEEPEICGALGAALVALESETEG